MKPDSDVRFSALAQGMLLTGLALIVFIFLPGPPYRLDQYDLPKDITLGLLGLGCGLQLLRRQDFTGDDRIGFTLLAFLCWGAMAIPVLAINQVQGWRTLGIFVASANVFMLARAAGTIGAAFKIYRGTIAILFVMCVLVMLEAYGGIPFLSAPGRRPGGTLGNRNLAARLACLALPLLWNWLIAVKRTTTRLMLLAILASMIGVIVLSRSRGAFLVSFALVTCLPLATRWRASSDIRRRWRMEAFAWMVAVALAGATVVVVPNHLRWTATDFASSALRVGEYERGTGRGRVIQAATTWRMIQQNPVWGVGPGNWSVVYPAYASSNDPSVSRGAYYPGPQIPRNDILPLIAEWGVLGAGVWLTFFLALGDRTLRLLASGEARARSAGAIVLGTSIAAMLLGMFDSVTRVTPTVALTALIAGLALGDGEAADVQRRVESYGRQRRYGWKLLLGACCVVSLTFARNAAEDFGALRIVNSFSSARDLARAVSIAPNNVEARALLSFVLVGAGRCDLAAPHLRRAGQLQPFSRSIAIVQEQCGLANANTEGSP